MKLPHFPYTRFFRFQRLGVPLRGVIGISREILRQRESEREETDIEEFEFPKLEVPR